MLPTLLVLAALLVVPGWLLARLLTDGGPVERAGWSVALSVGILVVVGGALGFLGHYRFAKTGAPVVEGALVALSLALAWAGLRRRRTGEAVAPPAPDAS